MFIFGWSQIKVIEIVLNHYIVEWIPFHLIYIMSF